MFYADKTQARDYVLSTRSFYMPKYIAIDTTLDSYGLVDNNVITQPGAWTGNYNLDIVNLCNQDPQNIEVKNLGDPLAIAYKKIGDNFSLCARARIETYSKHLDSSYTPEMIFGDNVNIGYDCHIGCVNKVIIGNNVLMASKIFITDHFHGDTSIDSLKLPPNNRKVISKGSVIIEDNVWIGEGVAIMPNVTIGANSIIGANSVVTKDIPKNSVVAGNPASVIKNIVL